MLQNSSMFRVLEPFFNEPSRHHYLMDISRRINLAHTSVKRDLDWLVKSGIINKALERRGKRKFPVYTANIQSREYLKMKALRNLRRISESGLVSNIESAISPKCIVLFGSYFRGEDMEHSDIDIFIECKEEKISLERYEKLLGRKIQLHFKQDFSQYPAELKNNIANGVVLSGFLEAFK